MSKILVVPDLHIPYHHPRALAFIDSCFKKYKPDMCINLGDEISNSKISFHQQDPDNLFSPSSELKISIEWMKELYKITPGIPVKVMNSNHGSLVYRKGKWAGLSKEVFRNWSDILEAPSNWSWHNYFIHENVYYHHGLSSNSRKLSLLGMNSCFGHFHTKFEVTYNESLAGQTWTMFCGCLIDNSSPEFDYNKNQISFPVNGCGLIVDGVPFLIPMKKIV